MVSRIKGTSVKNYCTATNNPVEEPAVIVTTGLEGGENMDAQRTQNLKLRMPAPGRNRPTQTSSSVREVVGNRKRRYGMSGKEGGPSTGQTIEKINTWTYNL